MYPNALVGPCFLHVLVVSPDVRSLSLLDAPLVALVAHSSVHTLLSYILSALGEEAKNVHRGRRHLTQSAGARFTRVKQLRE